MSLNLKARIFSDQALKYHEKSYSVIPVKGKRPITKEWSSWATKPQSRELLQKWIKEFPDAGIGLVLGPQSGVVALDLDLDLSEPADAALYEKFKHLIPESPVRSAGKRVLPGSSRLHPASQVGRSSCGPTRL